MARAFVSGVGWVEKQTKIVDVGENGTVDILPDEGKLLEKVTVNTNTKAEDLFQYLTCYNGTFRKAVFPENYHLVAKTNLANAWSTDLSMMFYTAKNLKSIKLIDESGYNNALNMASAFRDMSAEIIDLTEFVRKIKQADWMFLGGSKLKSILGALDFSECDSPLNWLNGAPALEDIEFVPNTIHHSIDFYWCTKLTRASIGSIIGGLDRTEGRGATTVTLSLAAVNKAFETSEGANDGAESDYFNNLCATPRVCNWTISLV